MNFFNNTKGAVSIFLVIILVPMMTVSALFVDASKVQLGKSVAESAGDLALNTALTNYDTLLKDIYGIFATAQDSGELYEKLEDYYRTAIMSAGLNEANAQSYTDVIMQQLGLSSEENAASDILNMKLVDFSANKLADSDLANPAILKKQIVSFMKYRSPINTGLGFLSSLQSFSSLSEQTDLVDKRQAYYKAEESVMGHLKTAWQYINDYNNLKLDNGYFTTAKSTLNGYESKFKAMNEKTILDLYDTQSYINFSTIISSQANIKVVTPNNSEGVDTTVWNLSGYKNYSQYGSATNEYSKDNLPTEGNIKSLINSFNSYYQTYTTNISKLVGTYDNRSQYYDVQYLAQNLRRGYLKEADKAAKNAYWIYQQLKNARIWLDDYDNQKLEDSTGTIITSDSIKKVVVSGKSIETWIGTVGENKEIDNKFNSMMQAYKPIADHFTSLSSIVKNGGKTSTDAVNTQVSGIASAVNAYVAKLEKASDRLNEAIKELNSAKTSIEAGGALDTAKNSWSNAANNLDNTSMGKQDKAEIQQLGQYLNPTEIGKLITRLQNVKADIDANVGQIKAYLFDGVYIGDINSYGALASVIAATAGDNELKTVPLRRSEIVTKAENWFSWTSGKFNTDWIDDSQHQPVLTTDKVKFYDYLLKHFGGSVNESGETQVKQEKPDEGKNLYENIKTKSGTEAKDEAKVDSGNKVSGNNIKGKEGLPSAGDSGSAAKMDNVNTGDSAASNTSSGLTGLLGSLLGALANLAEDVRDNLYVSDYVLSMFSYDTIENEFKLKKNTETLDIKTLTLIPINSDNNYAYGSEVEYILYGDTNSKNVTYAYTTIYGIRLAFNLIYAFMTAEIRDTAFALATPISAATLGVVPVPLIQAVIIVALACCESGFDIADLKKGEAVPLFKTNTTWRASPSGLIEMAKGLAADVAKKAGTAAIDATSQKLSEFLDMTDEQLNDDIDTYKDQIETHLGTAFDNTIGNAANSAIQKLTNLANDAIEQSYADASFNIKQYITQGLDNWLASESCDSSDLFFLAKKEAVNIIKANYIDQIVEELKKAKESASDTVDDLSSNLNSILSQIRAKITRQVTNASDAIKNYKTDMINEVKNSMSQGAESLKNTLNTKIDGLFGDTSGVATGAKEDRTSVATLFSFRYSDYLRLFLMIGLFTSPDSIIKRTADVIQVNMQIKDDKFSMFKAATYVEINATIYVEPTLTALPLFADAVKDKQTGKRWYEIQYHDIRGY